MNKKHEPNEMRASSPFKWRSGTRKTSAYYVDYRCPECGASARRTVSRSLGGMMCNGVKQAVRWYNVTVTPDEVPKSLP